MPLSSASPVIIGVAGGSGSGKTSVVRKIVEHIGPNQVSRIQHDSYYYDRSHVPPADRGAINYDHPNALETSLLIEHVRALKQRQPVEIPTYDFANHARLPGTQRVTPDKVVIIEGILVLADAALRELMDIRVFVDADPDLRILRRLRRDINRRRRTFESVVEQYLSTVRPMHLEFVEPSKRNAHVIIPEGARNTVAVDMLITKIRSILDGQ